MASESEATCEGDPNFAVICGFLEKFGVLCGLATIDFHDLQEMLENTHEVAQFLVDLHIKLLRKVRKSVSTERWERAVIKICHSYNTQDAWEVERFGYKKARIGSKLRILKHLLEMQFDLNTKFKTEINKMSATDLRTQPMGRDKMGHAYWYQSDESCQIRIYKEDPDEETWALVAKDRNGLLSLISELDGKETSEEAVLNDDSNSLEIEKPILDTGQVDSTSESSKPSIKSSEEEDDTSTDVKLNAEEDKSSVDDEKSLSVEDEKSSDEKAPTLKVVEENSSEVSTDMISDTTTSNGTDSGDKPKPLEVEEPRPLGLRLKPLTELLSQPHADAKPELSGVKEKYIRGDTFSSISNRKAVDSASGFAEIYRSDLKRPLAYNIEQPSMLKRPRMDRPTLLGNKKMLKPYIPEDDDEDDEVGEAIEEPLMLVMGKGSGEDNNSECPIVGDVIEDDVIYVYGEGSGVECTTGNEDEKSKDSDVISESKTDKKEAFRSPPKKSRWDAGMAESDDNNVQKLVDKWENIGKDDDKSPPPVKPSFFFGPGSGFGFKSPNTSPIKSTEMRFGAAESGDDLNKAGGSNSKVATKLNIGDTKGEETKSNSSVEDGLIKTSVVDDNVQICLNSISNNSAEIVTSSEIKSIVVTNDIGKSSCSTTVVSDAPTNKSGDGNGTKEVDISKMDNTKLSVKDSNVSVNKLKGVKEMETTSTKKIGEEVSTNDMAEQHSKEGNTSQNINENQSVKLIQGKSVKNIETEIITKTIEDAKSIILIGEEKSTKKTEEKPVKIVEDNSTQNTGEQSKINFEGKSKNIEDATKTIVEKSTKITVDKSTTIIAEKSTKNMTDTSTKHAADKSTIIIAEKSTQNLADKSTQNLADKSTQNLADNSTQNKVDKLTNITADKSTRSVEDKSTKNIMGEILTKTVDVKRKETADKSTKNISEKSTKITVETATKSIAEPTQNIADKSAKIIADKTAKIIADKSAKIISDKSASITADKSTKNIADKSTKDAAGTSPKSIAEPTQNIADKSGKITAEKSTTKITSTSTKNPVETSTKSIAELAQTIADKSTKITAEKSIKCIGEENTKQIAKELSAKIARQKYTKILEEKSTKTPEEKSTKYIAEEKSMTNIVGETSTKNIGVKTGKTLEDKSGKAAKQIEDKSVKQIEDKFLKHIENKIEGSYAMQIEDNPHKLIEDKSSKLVEHKSVNVVEDKSAKLLDKSGKQVDDAATKQFEAKSSTNVENKYIGNKSTKCIIEKPATITKEGKSTIDQEKFAKDTVATNIDAKPSKSTKQIEDSGNILKEEKYVKTISEEKLTKNIEVEIIKKGKSAKSVENEKDIAETKNTDNIKSDKNIDVKSVKHILEEQSSQSKEVKPAKMIDQIKSVKQIVEGGKSLNRNEGQSSRNIDPEKSARLNEELKSTNTSLKDKTLKHAETKSIKKTGEDLVVSKKSGEGSVAIKNIEEDPGALKKIEECSDSMKKNLLPTKKLSEALNAMKKVEEHSVTMKKVDVKKSDSVKVWKEDSEEKLSAEKIKTCSTKTTAVGKSLKVQDSSIKEVVNEKLSATKALQKEISTKIVEGEKLSTVKNTEMQSIKPECSKAKIHVDTEKEITVASGPNTNLGSKRVALPVEKKITQLAKRKEKKLDTIVASLKPDNPIVVECKKVDDVKINSKVPKINIEKSASTSVQDDTTVVGGNKTSKVLLEDVTTTKCTKERDPLEILPSKEAILKDVCSIEKSPKLVANLPCQNVGQSCKLEEDESKVDEIIVKNEGKTNDNIKDIKEVNKKDKIINQDDNTKEIVTKKGNFKKGAVKKLEIIKKGVSRKVTKKDEGTKSDNEETIDDKTVGIIKANECKKDSVMNKNESTEISKSSDECKAPEVAGGSGKSSTAIVLSKECDLKQAEETNVIAKPVKRSARLQKDDANVVKPKLLTKKSEVELSKVKTSETVAAKKNKVDEDASEVEDKKIVEKPKPIQPLRKLRSGVQAPKPEVKTTKKKAGKNKAKAQEVANDEINHEDVDMGDVEMKQSQLKKSIDMEDIESQIVSKADSDAPISKETKKFCTVEATEGSKETEEAVCVQKKIAPLTENEKSASDMELEEPTKKPEEKKLTLLSLSFDYTETTAADVQEVIKRVTRKRGRVSPVPEPIDDDAGGKRRKVRGKRTIDVELRRSIEEQKKKEVSSSEEEAKQPQKKHKIKPKKHPVTENVDETTTEPKPKKERHKKRRTLLGLDIPETSEADTPIGVRQSRRIAQIKIKEEAERRKIEDIVLADPRDKKEKKRKKKNDDNDYKAEKRKRNKHKATSSASSSEGGETTQGSDDKKKRKKKRRRNNPKFDEANPWQSSSAGTSSDSHPEDDEEEPEYEEEDDRRSQLFKSDHEFSPESDLEDGSEPQLLKRARTVRKEDAVAEEVEPDDTNCQKCGKSDHPEWILLCDGCDFGWHCSCLRPALLVIPEGDWYCPPCQHMSLVKNLHKRLEEFDKQVSKREIEVRRKERLAYVGISLDNVLPTKEHDDTHKKPRHRRSSDDSESAESRSSSSSRSSSGSSSDSDDEPIYQLRQRRQAHSYRFNDYDDLINSAIQDEVNAAVQQHTAVVVSRGKDMANVAAEEPEALPPVVPANTDLPQTLPLPAAEESDEDIVRPVKKIIGKKKHRKLNSLDVSSDDEHASDEDFKGSSSDDDDEDEFDEELGSDSSEFGRRGRRGPVRRSTRARISRYDRDFIDDDSEDEAPRRKKTRSIWDESESEESDRSWGRRKKRSGGARRSAPAPKKKKPKKKKKNDDDSDIEVYRKKKPKIKYGGLESEDEDEGDGRRKTRGRKINYVDVLGTDSEDENGRRRNQVKEEESEDEFVLNEENDNEVERDSDDSNDGPVVVGAVIKVGSKKGKGKGGMKRIKRAQGEEEVALFPPLEQPAEAVVVEPPKPAVVEPVVVEPEPNPIEEINKNLEAMDEKEMEMMMEEEEYANRQLQMVAAQLEKEKRRRELEAAKQRMEMAVPVVAPPPIQIASLVEAPVPITVEEKTPKKRGRKPKSAMVSPVVAESPTSVFNITPPVENMEMGEFSDAAPMHVALNPDGTPKKRRGRGKGKKTLEKEAAAAAAHSSSSTQPSPNVTRDSGDSSEIPLTVEAASSNKVAPPADSPMLGGKLGVASAPQPFSQSQPKPSVITRMLQTQAGQPSYPVGSGHKFFADQRPGGPSPPLQGGPPPGPFISGPGGPRGVLPPGFRPNMNHYPPPVRGLGPRLRSPAPQHMFHPMDPSPSGGGPIPLPERSSPNVVSPSSASPVSTKGDPTPPPPPYIRPPMQRFPQMPPRHMLQQHLQPRPPYHPNMPPNFHYGPYPPPPANEDGDSFQNTPPYPPEQYQSEPPTTDQPPKNYDEENGEFGGLVSYFSSQREDDLDT